MTDSPGENPSEPKKNTFKKQRKAVPARKHADSHAREIALQALYQVEVIGSPLQNVLRLEWLSTPPRAEVQTLAENTIQDVYDNWDSLDDVIRSLSSKDITQISIISRCILRMGLLELMQSGEDPGRAIDDLLNLTRRYDGEESVAFVNGILDRFLQEKDRA